LAGALGLGPDDLWIKRDDLTGLAGGGNKIRKLEWTVAAAIVAGADVLVTTGAPQSNHAPASDCGWCWCSPAIRVGRNRETSRWTAFSAPESPGQETSGWRRRRTPWWLRFVRKEGDLL
jgi:hypothetical protein